MSSDDADHDEDLGHARFIRMRASETFDGQESVMTRAAWDLQVQATVHSASCGHPGFVPDDYLEHLDGLSIETTITAAELCTSGMWERIDGGYRVLDWEAQVHTSGLMTTPDSARTATLLTASSTGMSLSPGSVTAPAAMARAWTRTGRR